MTVLDDLLLTVAHEHSHDVGAEEHVEHRDRHAERARHQRAFFDALLDPIKLLSAEVLSGVGGDRHAERHHGHDRNAVDTMSGGERRDRDRSQTVQCHLQDDRADRYDRRLKAHRQTEPRMLPQNFAIEFPIVGVSVEDRHATFDVDYEEQIADQQRDDRRPRRARDSAVENDDRDRLEYDVDGQRRRLNDGRRFAVAERAEQI